MIEKDYEMFISEIEGKFNEFLFNARKGEKVKASALLARKAAMSLRIMLKEFRLVSVDNSKKTIRRTIDDVEL